MLNIVLMISNRKELNMGTLAEDKAKALKQARLERKQNRVVTKKDKPKEIPIETVIDMSCL